MTYTTHIDDGDWRGADGEEGETLIHWKAWAGQGKLGRPGSDRAGYGILGRPGTSSS